MIVSSHQTPALRIYEPTKQSATQKPQKDPLADGNTISYEDEPSSDKSWREIATEAAKIVVPAAATIIAALL